MDATDLQQAAEARQSAGFNGVSRKSVKKIFFVDKVRSA
jgi:hypothetical protein